jgi:hypothetical protein
MLGDSIHHQQFAVPINFNSTILWQEIAFES